MSERLLHHHYEEWPPDRQEREALAREVFGERIVSGLALNDTAQTLAGAVPAAVLAIVVQGAFAGLERLGMRAVRTADRQRRSR